MKEITDEQIREAEANHYLNQPALGSGNKSGWRCGVEWMQEQLQSKWTECKYRDRLPYGHYLLKIYKDGIEQVIYQPIDFDTPFVGYYNAVGCMKIELPA